MQRVRRGAGKREAPNLIRRRKAPLNRARFSR
jgi:hypothetical protein